MSEDGIDYELLERLVRNALKENGGRFTASALSRAATFGKNRDLVRNFLGPRRTKPSMENAAGLANALGLTLAHFMPDWDGPVPPRKMWLTVNSSVEAGVWREQVEWGPADWYEVQVEISHRTDGEYGFVVQGRSMDKVLPPGTILRCVDPITSFIEMRPDDYVVVERQRAGLVELTCKRLALRPDGNWELRAESYLPEFEEPIFIGRPTAEGEDGFDAMNEDEIRIRAVVVEAYLPLARRQTRPVY